LVLQYIVYVLIYLFNLHHIYIVFCPSITSLLIDVKTFLLLIDFVSVTHFFGDGLCVDT